MTLTIQSTSATSTSWHRRATRPSVRWTSSGMWTQRRHRMSRPRHQSSTTPSVTQTSLSMSASSWKSSSKPSVTYSSSSIWPHSRHRMPTPRHRSLTRPSGRQRRQRTASLTTSTSVGQQVRCGGPPIITSRGGVKTSLLWLSYIRLIHTTVDGSRTASEERCSKACFSAINDYHHHNHRPMTMIIKDDDHGDKGDEKEDSTSTNDSLPNISGLKIQNSPRNFTKTLSAIDWFRKNGFFGAHSCFGHFGGFGGKTKHYKSR